MRTAPLLSLLAGLASTAAAISTISIKGSKFFLEDGSQWFVKGIAYQRSPADPLIDTTQCKLDADLMGQLGANAIRVYHVDPKADHTGCMGAFADKGIYLFVDLDTFETQIDQSGPPKWNQTQLSAFEAVYTEFAKFTNTAGVFIGNEIITTGNGSYAAPYIKAAIRDVKAWRDKQSGRKLPIGYSAADIASLRPMLQNYLACGPAESSLEFFGLNAYEWCGKSSFEQSGYSQLTAQLTNYPIPVFFSETGCNTVPPRDFGDQLAIFGPQMSGIWSGAIIYEWIQEANAYGLISYGPLQDVKTVTEEFGDQYPRRGTPTPVLPDFTNLKSQWAIAKPTGTSRDAYNPTNSAPTCPPATSGVWNVAGNVALPTLGQTAEALAINSVITASPTFAGASSTASGSASSSSTTKKNTASSQTILRALISLTLLMMTMMTL